MLVSKINVGRRNLSYQSFGCKYFYFTDHCKWEAENACYRCGGGEETLDRMPGSIQRKNWATGGTLDTGQWTGYIWTQERQAGSHFKEHTMYRTCEKLLKIGTTRAS